MRVAVHGRFASRAALCSVALLVAAASAAGCRRGVPIIDTAPAPARADGTISGTVRGPEGTSAIEGRTVEIVNLDTGERQRTATGIAGGFTFKLPPGKYRLELVLLDGEVLVKKPGIIDLDRSDVDAYADFVVGSSRVSRPQTPLPLRLDHGLGSPIA